MKVSVVMAVHNGARFLADQLDSILQADRAPDELVVVDDASTDGGQQLVLEKLERHPSVSLKLLTNDRNMGPTASFAKGLLTSIGDIVLFSDQDDRWMPHKVSSCVLSFAERPDTLLVYSDGLITDAELAPDGRTIFGTRKHAKLTLGADRDPLEVAANPDIKGCTMALDGHFARRLFSDSDPAYMHYWGHDHWAALFAMASGKVTVIHEPLLWHRFHADNTSRAERLSLWRWTQVARYLRTARQQAPDHFCERYRVALQQARSMGELVRPVYMDALAAMLVLSKRREDLRALPLPAKVRSAWQLHREGIYAGYYNGIATLVRDIML